MATTIDLTPELERFAQECVDDGLYNDVSDVIRSGLRLLQEQQEARRAFEATLREAEEEADRDGWLTTDEVMADLDAVIKKHRR
ncbi:MAG TPA: type II toxin-antitoxin system ParD family antitoxin [Stellaceae bacterium]|nr:type II toxin-antitoxin system ParD family antitoxin [Stellaceae bacterium]